MVSLQLIKEVDKCLFEHEEVKFGGLDMFILLSYNFAVSQWLFLSLSFHRSFSRTSTASHFSLLCETTCLLGIFQIWHSYFGIWLCWWNQQRASLVCSFICKFVTLLLLECLSLNLLFAQMVSVDPWRTKCIVDIHSLNKEAVFLKRHIISSRMDHRNTVYLQVTHFPKEFKRV